MGDSLASVLVHSSLSVVPVDAAPAPPSGVSAAAGLVGAMLAWSAPDDDGGHPVIGYRIESSTDGVSWTILVADTGSTTTSFTASGLAAEVPVRFRVAAINAVGVSPPTLPTAAVIPSAAPEPPPETPPEDPPEAPEEPPIVAVVPLTPARLLDSRAPDSTVDGVGSGGGPVAAGSITEVQVAGRGGVPAGAVAAVLNVTVVGPVADAFATVFPCGQSVPTASNVNYRAGVDIANSVVVQLGPGGKACIYTFAATQCSPTSTATSRLTSATPHPGRGRGLPRGGSRRVTPTPSSATVAAGTSAAATAVPGSQPTSSPNVTIDAGDAGAEGDAEVVEQLQATPSRCRSAREAHSAA